MKKKILVIGGGVAGLSVGGYLAMNGFHVEIYERNQMAGGVCNSWQRGDYTIDLCIHLLAGAGPESVLYEKWNEIAAMDEIGYCQIEEYIRVEDKRRNAIRVFADPDRLEQELLEKAPEDTEAIKELTAALRKLAQYEEDHDKAPELTTFWERVRHYGSKMPYQDLIERFSKISLEDYAAEFSNPLLQKVILNLSEPRASAICALMGLAWMGVGKAAYPRGGSMPFAQHILDRFLSLGGRIFYQAKVDRILVEDNRAVGILLEDGRQIPGDYVVSASDGHATIYELLQGNYVGKVFEKFYREHETFPSLFFIALGVRKELSDLPAHLLFPIRGTLIIDPDTIIDELSVRIHHFDPLLAPKGKTLVSIPIKTANFGYWRKLQQSDPAKYESEKDRITRGVVAALEERFGNFSKYVEMIDVATPSTIIDFTNNWKGSSEGWILDPKTGLKSLPHTLPKLHQFYMCGQWIAIGGGLPGVLLSARDVAQLICDEEGLEFRHYPAEKKLVP